MSLEIIETLDITDINIQKVVEMVSSVTGVKEHQMRSSRRDRHIVFARNMCFSVLRHALGMTYMHIGSCFDKHHATIIYAVKVNDQDMESNVAYRARFQTILSHLGVRFMEQVSHGDTMNRITQDMFRREPMVID